MDRLFHRLPGEFVPYFFSSNTNCYFWCFYFAHSLLFSFAFSPGDLEMLLICQSCPSSQEHDTPRIIREWIQLQIKGFVQIWQSGQIRRLVTSVFAGHWPKSISAIPPAARISSSFIVSFSSPLLQEPEKGGR